MISWRRFLFSESFMVYQAAVLLVPELIVGLLLQSITALTSHQLDQLSKRRISFDEFCSKIDVARVAYSNLGKVREALMTS